jgi:hypothetical protein
MPASASARATSIPSLPMSTATKPPPGTTITAAPVAMAGSGRTGRSVGRVTFRTRTNCALRPNHCSVAGSPSRRAQRDRPATASATKGEGRGNLLRRGGSGDEAEDARQPHSAALSAKPFSIWSEGATGYSPEKQASQ